MKSIPLGGKYGIGKYALVDDQDFDWLNQWKWHCSPSGYAIRKPKAGQINMHRLINNTPNGYDTDHINGEPLDNRRLNLRTATHQQNMINQKLRSDNKTGYTGVSWYKSRSKYQVRLKVGGKYLCLGYYKTLAAAWLARRWGERLYFGEFART